MDVEIKCGDNSEEDRMDRIEDASTCSVSLDDQVH